MHFEDYNYEMYNRHVLINPNIEDDPVEDDEENEEQLGFQPPTEDD